MSRRFKGHPEFNFSSSDTEHKDFSLRNETDEPQNISEPNNEKIEKNLKDLTPEEIYEFLRQGPECRVCGLPLGLGTCNACIRFLRQNGFDYPLPQLQSTSDMLKETSDSAHRFRMAKKVQSLQEFRAYMRRKFKREAEEDSRKKNNKSGQKK